MPDEWDEGEAALRSAAGALRTSLELDDRLGAIGSVSLVGAAALRTMVAHDLDLTVTVADLGPETVRAVSRFAAGIAANPQVREVLIRNDTGRWNVDPRYPDGIYVRLEAADADDVVWSVDVWFIDEPERQPDLLHLRTLQPRIDPGVQAAVLEIKRERRWLWRGGSRMPSVEVYFAVIDHDVKSVEQFRTHMGDRIV